MRHFQKEKLEDMLYGYADRLLKDVAWKTAGEQREESPEEGMEDMKDFLEEVIAYRIDGILFTVHQEDREKTKTGADLIESVSPEVRRQMEQWIDSCLEWSWKDCMIVYREAFRDGMRLAKKIFA